MTPRLRRLLLPIAALALAASACSSLSVAAASVNGEKITEAEVEDELDRVRSDPTFQDLLRQQADQVRGFTRRQILTAMIQQLVMEQAARELGIEVTGEQIDRLISEQAARQGISVDEFLEAQNLTEEGADAIAERVVRQFALQERVMGEVEIEDEEVQQVYEENIASFEQVRLLRITVATQEDAEAVLEDLDAGRGFFAVARESSIDDLAAEGGDMGLVPVTELSGAAVSAIGSVSERGITEPVPSAAGFEIYQVLERQTRPLAEVEAQIRSQMLGQAQERAFGEWLEGRLRQAQIVVNPKYGRFDDQSLEVAAPDGEPRE